MGFFNKISGKAGFFNKVEEKGGNFLGKVDKLGNKIASISEDAIKLGGKIMDVAGKVTGALAASGIPVLSNAVALATPLLARGEAGLKYGSNKLDQYNDKRAEIKDKVKQVKYDFKNGEGAYENSKLNNELPGIGFD